MNLLIIVMVEIIQPPGNRVKLITGWESSGYPPEYGDINVIDVNEHADRFREDLRLMKETGITISRAPVPWHQIQKTSDITQADWRWVDEYLKEHDKLGIFPVVDLCHHTCVPRWIDCSYANIDFSNHFMEYVMTFNERYPEIKAYTLINEPVVTSALCGDIWYPKMKDRIEFMRRNMARAIAMSANELKQVNPEIEIWHTDPAEKWYGIDDKSKEQAKKMNEIRFLFMDTLCGFVNENHPLRQFLLDSGWTEEDLDFHVVNPAAPDVFLLDYYVHNEKIIGDIDDKNKPKFKGMARTSLDYINRYSPLVPSMRFGTGEFNGRSSPKARVYTLRRSLREAEVLKRAAGKDKNGNPKYIVAGYYPFLNSTDWGMPEGVDGPGPMTALNAVNDPVGIVDFDSDTGERIKTEVTTWTREYVVNNISPFAMPNFAPDKEQLNHPKTLRRYEGDDSVIPHDAIFAIEPYKDNSAIILSDDQPEEPFFNDINPLDILKKEDNPEYIPHVSAIVLVNDQPEEVFFNDIDPVSNWNQQQNFENENELLGLSSNHNDNQFDAQNSDATNNSDVEIIPDFFNNLSAEEQLKYFADMIPKY